MLARIRKAEENDKGFTLIELLVVVIIIGILSAIAIPTFLKQREKAWDKAVKSDLRNNALKMEEYLDDFGVYPITADTTSGTYKFKNSQDVAATAVKSTTRVATGYCIQATHSKLTGANATQHIDSAVGKPADGACP